MNRLFLTTAAAILSATTAFAQCGGSFSGFVASLAAEARSKGHSDAAIQSFFRGVAQDSSVIKADRSQGVFQKDFLAFSQALVSQNRMDHGRKNASRYAAVFDQMQREYGVSPGVLLAFWGFETDYGVNQGNTNTRNALVTLAHDCRRPELFRPQVFAALELFERGAFDPQNTKGAWAGEIGQIQMLPEDLLVNGVDADGDGRVDLQKSAADALMTGARMLSQMGWQPNQPWLQEVIVPDTLEWAATGLDKSYPVSQWKNAGVQGRNGPLFNQDVQASLLLPQGRKGPAFLAYPNFKVYFEWNQSFVYVTTAAYFANRLMGEPRYDPGNPDQGLNGQQMQQLQQKLADKGYDVGKIDGILGARTRAAVQNEQRRLGLPADAWPTPALLSQL
ncbi:MAG: lytic murein transglycosylase [Planktomarina sp.]